MQAPGPPGPPIQAPTLKVTADDIVICRKCKAKDFLVINHFALVSTGVIGAPKQLVTLEQLLSCNHCNEYVDRSQPLLTQGDHLRKLQGPEEKRSLINVIPIGTNRDQEDEKRPAESGVRDIPADGQGDDSSELFRGRVDLPGEPVPGNSK